MDLHLADLTAGLGPHTPGDPDSLTNAATELGITWPREYVAFMTEQDGGEGWVGRSYLALWPAAGIVESNEGYRVGEFVPGLVLIGTNGGGEGFAFDFRAAPPTIVMLPLVGLDQPIVQGTTLIEFLERLHGDATFSAR